MMCSKLPCIVLAAIPLLLLPTSQTSRAHAVDLLKLPLIRAVAF